MSFRLTFQPAIRASIKGFVILFFFLSCFQIQAQDKEALRNKKSQLLRQIEATNQLLKETQKNKAASMSDLRAIQSKINARESLISNINQQKKVFQKAIYKIQLDIKTLQNDLEHYRDEYAKLSYYTYKSSLGNTPMLFLLSAKSFNDAMKRFSYLKRYNSYRKIQMNQIKETIMELDVKEIELKASKDSVQVLINEQCCSKK